MFGEIYYLSNVSCPRFTLTVNMFHIHFFGKMFRTLNLFEDVKMFRSLNVQIAKCFIASIDNPENVS